MKENNSTALISDFDEVDYCRFFSVLESPFNHDFDCVKFYGGANRQNVLEDVLIRIRRNDRNVFVSAGAGSGKTALCRMIEQDRLEDLCLYANCSGKARTIPLDKQIAEGLLLEATVFMPLTHIESALHRKLLAHDRVVILLEGVQGVTTEQFDWLSDMQDKAEANGKAITVVFLYSPKEQQTLKEFGIEENNSCIKLEPLIEYEVYEYLNDHMRKCGHDSIGVFTRATAKAIYTDSEGQFSHIVELANGTLRRSYRRSINVPAVYDVPVTRDAEQSIDWPLHGAALLTVRNTVIVGTISGAAVLVLIWSLFGVEQQPFRDAMNSSEQNLLVVSSDQQSK